MSAETPDTVHGRLMESVHIAGYTFERACDELEWLIDRDRWKTIGKGFRHVDEFLATLDLSKIKTSVEQRKSLARKLAALGAGQRATGKLIGVSEQTVARDLGKSRRGAPKGANSAPTTGDAAPKGAVWFQGDADPARIAKMTAARAEREGTREQVRQANAAKVATVTDPRELLKVGRFATIAIDPPWDFDDEGDVNQFGRGKHDYASKPIDDILTLPVDVLADTDCHLYLWITNRSLPKGFRLLEAWGFRYVTCLTWVKPSYGIGNYFRGQTEQILFGVKGSQPLKRQDVGTVFHASRGDVHSAKPDEFFVLVESCSPGPYLEMFQRRPRQGWSGWGEHGLSVQRL